MAVRTSENASRPSAIELETASRRNPSLQILCKQTLTTSDLRPSLAILNDRTKLFVKFWQLVSLLHCRPILESFEEIDKLVHMNGHGLGTEEKIMIGLDVNGSRLHEGGLLALHPRVKVLMLPPQRTALTLQESFESFMSQ